MAQKSSLKNQTLTLKTIFGTCKVGHPFIEIIKSPTIQRLKKISQSGVIKYFNTQQKDFSRYSHTIGVFVLLRKFKASTQEQIAGIFHDASHTVFSHVGDLVFHGTQEISYQDNIHEWFLKQQNIEPLLKKYNFSLKNIIHKSGEYALLEQNLPDVCIDRLEYNLHSGLNSQMISKQDIKQILQDLKFDNNTFFFTKPEIAKKLAKLSLELTEKIWCAPENILAYQLTAKALKHALEIKLISLEEIHFSVDQIVWNKLKKSKDTIISANIKKVLDVNKYFEISPNSTEVLKGKFRGIDPFVKIDNKLSHLTELDPEFKNEFNKVKNLIKNGTYVKIL